MQMAEPYFPPPAAMRDDADDRDKTPLPRSRTTPPHGTLTGAALLNDSGSAEEPEPSQTTSVPPAELLHAGMFNPWDDRASPAPAAPVPPPQPRFGEEEEVITSVRPHQLAAQRAEALAAAASGGRPPSEPPEAALLRAALPSQPGAADPFAKPAPPRPGPPRPPPLPPRARKPPVPTPAPPAMSIPTPTEAMLPAPLQRPAPPSSPRMTPAPPSPTQVMALPDRQREVEADADADAEAMAQADARAEAKAMAQAEVDARAEAEAEAHARVEAEAAMPAVEPTEPKPLGSQGSEPEILPKLDLTTVDAFADLPDDAREAFAAAAQVSALGEGEEVSGFALAYMLSGTVDVAATMVDAPAARLEGGAVLRSRGTMEEGVPIRLIGVAAGVVATWTDAAVEAAFRTCPWVEEDLRTAADRLQTLVGVTIGPLGERLDASIREQIIGRLTMRTLTAGDVVVTAGQPVPGLLLIGVGELELVDGDKVTGVVGSGEFLFPGEVLGAGAAPMTARAGPGGALILFGDRMIAQELLVTCPPLLEVFAGM